jgi:hypothetical protein
MSGDSQTSLGSAQNFFGRDNEGHDEKGNLSLGSAAYRTGKTLVGRPFTHFALDIRCWLESA